MLLGNDLLEARFLRRENRFLATVELDGQEAAVHVANSGRLRELFVPGATVWLKPAAHPGRRSAYDLALVQAEGVLVSADARLPNAVVAEAAFGGLFGEVQTPAAVVRESTFGESRFDLMLEQRDGRRYIEVKSVTLVQEGVGLFPDSPTTRGAKHLNTLVQAVHAGHQAPVIFVIQRPDADAFSTNDDADPALAEAFRNAVAHGVEARAYNCRVSLVEVSLDRRLPIVPFDSIDDVQAGSR